jgi:TP901 family phage tail tape measure protein
MSEAATDILLRIKVEVTGLSAIKQLNDANARVQMTQDRLAASTARVATAQTRLAAAQSRASTAASQAAAAQVRVTAAQSRADKAATDLQAAQARLNAAQTNSATSATRLQRAELAVQQASARLAAAQAGVANAESRAQAAATRAAAAVVGLGAAQSRASTASSNAAAASARVTTAQNNASASASRAAVAAARLAQVQANLANANGKVGKSTGILMGIYEKFSNRLNRVERAMDAVFRAGVHLQAMGRDLVGFGKRIVGVIDGMLDKWGEFEFTLNRAAGAAGIFDNTLPIYDALKKKVQDVAREMRLFPAEEVAKGLYFWQSTTGEVIKTQDDLERSMKNVSAIMKLSAMTNTNYETAIKGVYAVLKQFNKPMSETEKVVSLLHFATQKTALEFPNLIESFKMFGAVAGNAKEPLETMVAVLGALGDAGFRGSQVGRALRQTYIKIVKPTAAAKEKLNELFKAQGGYNKVAFDSKGNFVGMEKYIWKLAKATKNMTYQQKANLLATITTANELPVMTEMLDIAHSALKDGAKSWVDYRVNQKDATEGFKKSWDILAGSWAGIKGLLRQTIEPVLLNIGQMIAKKLTPILEELSATIYEMAPVFEETAKTIADAVMPVIDWLLESFNKVMAWAKKNPSMVKQFAKWAALGTIFAVVAGAIMLAVGTLIFFVNTIVLVIAGMLPMLATIAAVIAAFVLLGTRIYQNAGGIRDALGNLFRALSDAFDRLFGGIDGTSKGIGGLIDNITRLIDKGLGKLADFVNWLADAIDRMTPQDVETLKGVAGALVAIAATWKGLNILNDSFKALNESLRGFKMVASGISTVASGIAGIPGMISAAPGALTAVAGGIRAIGAALAANPIGLVIMAIVAAIAAFVVAYETNFLGFRDFVDGIVLWFQTNVGPVIAQVFQWLQEVIPPILQGIADFVNNVLVPAFTSMVNWLVETFTPVFEQIGDTLAAAGEFFGLLGDKITEVVNAIMGWLDSLGLNVDTNFNGIQEIINAVLTFIGEFIGNWLEAIFAVWSTMWNGISTAVKIIVETIASVIEGFFQIIEGVFNVFTALLTGDWDTFWKGIQNIVDGILKIVGGIINGFIEGMKNVISTGLGIVDGVFKAFFGDGPDSIYSHVKGFIDTIIKFGGDVVGGLVKGIGDAVGGAITSITGFVGDIIDGIKDFLGIASPATIMLSIGKNIVAGLWKGINDAKDWIIDKVMTFIKNVIPGPILDALGIKSPSRVMAAIGENIVRGLAVGIERTDDAYNAMVAQASAITDAMNGVSESATSVSGAFTSSTSTDATRTINLNVDVTSGDGSVSGLDMTTLSNLITGSDMVRALEHMSAVD